MATSTATRFPDVEIMSRLKGLIKQHLKLKDEPLLLAVYYAPTRCRKDIFLFEVADNFGQNSIDPDRDLWEVGYRSAPSFPLAEEQYLRLVLTNPEECGVAFKEKWPLASEIRRAFRRGKAVVLHATPEGQKLLGAIRG